MLPLLDTGNSFYQTWKFHRTSLNETLCFVGAPGTPGIDYITVYPLFDIIRYCTGWKQ